VRGEEEGGWGGERGMKRRGREETLMELNRHIDECLSRQEVRNIINRGAESCSANGRSDAREAVTLSANSR